jgi:hypothetical protein
MPRVGAKIGLTIKLNKDANFEYVRPEIEITDIDTEKNIELQLIEAHKALEKVYGSIAKKMSEIMEAQYKQITNEIKSVKR